MSETNQHTECCDPSDRRCLYFACGKRQDYRHGKWWCDYGTCGRQHAVDHYGEECVE